MITEIFLYGIFEASSFSIISAGFKALKNGFHNIDKSTLI